MHEKVGKERGRGCGSGSSASEHLHFIWRLPERHDCTARRDGELDGGRAPEIVDEQRHAVSFS
eukprot:scaffold240856_cov27-Tisochrysis_lutea.AAC.4